MAIRPLFVAPFGEYGGSEMVLLRVIEDLGERFEGRALLLGPGPLERMLSESGLSVDVEPMLGKRALVRFPAAAAAWARRLEDERIDMIHANQAKAAIFSTFLARRLRIPLLWMKHDHFFDGRVAQAIGRRCDHVVCVSHTMAAQFTDEMPERVSVVYPGVRMPPPPKARPTGPVIATVGRLDPLKAFGSVIRAVHLLRERGHDAKARLAGPVDRVYPEHATELRALVAELDLEGHVTIGFLDDLDEHYRSARVLVLSSPPKPGGLPSEGAPTVLMEAMAHGTAVAAARQPGTEEVMGEVGTLVDDLSPEGWANALEPYLRDPKLAAQVGREGRVRAEERFTMHRTVEQLEELYERVAARGRAPRRPGGVVRARY